MERGREKQEGKRKEGKGGDNGERKGRRKG